MRVNTHRASGVGPGPRAGCCHPQRCQGHGARPRAEPCLPAVPTLRSQECWEEPHWTPRLDVAPKLSVAGLAGPALALERRQLGQGSPEACAGSGDGWGGPPNRQARKEWWGYVSGSSWPGSSSVSRRYAGVQTPTRASAVGRCPRLCLGLECRGLLRGHPVSPAELRS